jgi:hypothetical protein
VDIDVNPNDGSLWYLGLDGSVQRISFATENRARPRPLPRQQNQWASNHWP